MKYALLLCMLYLSGCSKYYGTQNDELQLSLVKSDSNHTTFTTYEVPQAIKGSSLKKVVVQLDKTDYYVTAFIELDQIPKITEKGQHVLLYELSYMPTSGGGRDWLRFAKAQ